MGQMPRQQMAWCDSLSEIVVVPKQKTVTIMTI